ncbi:MAG TPA: fumarylacetoacetate hydrolase family protein [Candidatus Sulfotelmatobacter sp.]|nr:fumarylacetoacetate hydrolase family protein [Candidatus Sulfotelmatobacter sp.]
MRLALFDDWRLGAVDAAGTSLVDVTAAIPDWSDDELGAGWWVRLVRDFAQRRGAIERLAANPNATAIPLERVRLRASALNPTKIVAAAANYAAHVEEMRGGVLERVAGGVDPALLDFDVFLKAPSALCGPSDRIVLPHGPLVDGKEVHHECELTVVIGERATAVDAADALDHVFGYTIGLDVTVRGKGERVRRKSYDTFAPIGPWVTTADEIPDPMALDIDLTIDGHARQHVNTRDMTVGVADLIAYASAAMTLEPGDLLMTGAPPGVGEIHAGETLVCTVSRIGSFSIGVTAPTHAGGSA